MAYSQKVLQAAYTKFLEGKKGKEIVDEINKEFKLDIKLPSIYHWRNRYKWDARRDASQELALATISSENTDFLTEATRRHLEKYQQLTNKSGSFLRLDEAHPIPFDRPADAVKALDTGIKGERMVQAGLISYTFVQAVLSAVAEEIEDEDILRKIGIRLKELVSKAQYQKDEV